MPEQTGRRRAAPTIPKLPLLLVAAFPPHLGQDGRPTSRTQEPKERRHKEVMAWEEGKQQEPQR